MIKNGQICLNSILKKQLELISEKDIKLHAYTEKMDLITFNFEYNFYFNILDRINKSENISFIFFDDIKKENQKKHIINRKIIIDKLFSIGKKNKSFYEDKIDFIYNRSFNELYL
jgi:hypothetical protein